MRNITCVRVYRPRVSLTARCFSSVTQGNSGGAPASKQNVEVDVCIVGGGIVGSCVAAALKRAARTCDCPAAPNPFIVPSPSSSHSCSGDICALLLSIAPGPPAWLARHPMWKSAPPRQTVKLLHTAPTPQLSVIAECTPYPPRHGSCCKPWVRGSCCRLIAPTTTTRCRSCPFQVPVILVCDAVQVWQALGAGVLQLRAGDAGLESLGSIVGHSALQAALKQCVLDTDVICIGSHVRSISSLPPAAAAAAGHVLTAGDFSIACSLLVGADGAASRVRAHSGIGELLA